MKKLIYAIIIPLTMVCCQSENENVQEFEGDQTCVGARVRDGNFLGLASTHHTNVAGFVDGLITYQEDGLETHYRCFYDSQYEFIEMTQIVIKEFME